MTSIIIGEHRSDM